MAICPGHKSTDVVIPGCVSMRNALRVGGLNGHCAAQVLISLHHAAQQQKPLTQCGFKVGPASQTLAQH